MDDTRIFHAIATFAQAMNTRLDTLRVWPVIAVTGPGRSYIDLDRLINQAYDDLTRTHPDLASLVTPEQFIINQTTATGTGPFTVNYMVRLDKSCAPWLTSEPYGYLYPIPVRLPALDQALPLAALLDQLNVLTPTSLDEVSDAITTDDRWIAAYPDHRLALTLAP